MSITLDITLPEEGKNKSQDLPDKMTGETRDKTAECLRKNETKNNESRLLRPRKQERLMKVPAQEFPS